MSEHTQGQNPEQKISAETDPEFRARKNYGGLYKIGNITVPCYTKRQMKILYPAKNYTVKAEYAPKGAKNGAYSDRPGQNLFKAYKYRTASRLVYREAGYAAVGEDDYILLLKHALPLRVFVLVFAIAVISGGIATALQMSKTAIAPAGITAGSKVSAEFEPGAEDWTGIKVSEPENVPEDGIRIPGFKSITIEADKTEVSVNFQNPEQNNCYFVIRLVLKDTGETLYESKMIEPGKGLYTITLSRALAAGSYPAKLQYEPYDMTSLTRLNGAEINLELIAK